MLPLPSYALLTFPQMNISPTAEEEEVKVINTDSPSDSVLNTNNALPAEKGVFDVEINQPITEVDQPGLSAAIDVATVDTGANTYTQANVEAAANVNTAANVNATANTDTAVNVDAAANVTASDTAPTLWNETLQTDPLGSPWIDSHSHGSDAGWNAFENSHGDRERQLASISPGADNQMTSQVCMIDCCHVWH